MSYADEPDIIAFLHCEIPSGGNGKPISASAGTVDFDEVSGDGPSSRETIGLHEGQSFRLGRARANDLVVEHQGVSRFHVVFSASASGLVLSDLASLNGTLVNGRRISSPVDLSTGDVIGLGNVKITIELCRGIQTQEEQHDDTTVVSTHAAKMSAVVVTVLVTDVCGYTRLSQALPPHEVADMLNLWFRNVVSAITDHGGEVDKYIGDCVMALWRAGEGSAQNTAVRAIRAAERILKETRAMSETKAWKHQEEHPWRCRVALNSGDALMGTVGTAGSRDYTVLGDTVNVAFRLESLASEEGAPLVMSAATAKLVKDLLPVRSMGEVILEGRADNIEIFTLENIE